MFCIYKSSLPVWRYTEEDRRVETFIPAVCAILLNTGAKKKWVASLSFVFSVFSCHVLVVRAWIRAAATHSPGPWLWSSPVLRQTRYKETRFCNEITFVRNEYCNAFLLKFCNFVAVSSWCVTALFFSYKCYADCALQCPLSPDIPASLTCTQPALVSDKKRRSDRCLAQARPERQLHGKVRQLSCHALVQGGNK